MEHEALKNELEETFETIEHQILIIETYGLEGGVSPLQMKKSDGSWVMPELLLAKSNVLLALTALRED